MRLFAALEPPPRVRGALAAWAAEAAARDPALRMVPAPALHLTLHFLGERPAGEARALRAAVESAPDAPVRLRTTGTLWLAPRRPHVLTCGLESPDGALAALHEALGAGLRAAAPAWAPDARPLRPHITVARVRRGARPLIDRPPPAPAFAFEAAAVLLERSVPGSASARYETLARLPLRTGA